MFYEEMMKEKLLNELKKDGPTDFDLFLSDEALKVIPELLDELLQEWKEEVQEFIDKPNEETEFDEGMKISRFSLLWRILTRYLNYTQSNPNLSKIILDFLPKLKGFTDAADWGRNYYSKPYYEKLVWIKEHKNLTSDQKRILDLELPQYQKRGLALSEENQQKLQELNQQISSLQEQIKNNMTHEKDDFFFTFEDDSSLKELPDSLLEKMKALGKEGKLGVNADPTLIGAMLEYCNDSSLRKMFYDRQNQIGSQGKYDNRELIQTLLSLSQKKAHLLGYENAGEMHLSTTMAKHPEKVKQFLEDLQSKAKEKALQEKELLKEVFHLENLEIYDLPYYERKYKQEHYCLDEEKLKEYFEFNQVLSWLHSFVKEYFGLEFHKLDQSSSLEEMWYEVKKEGKVIAYYLLDPFYRPGKKPHGRSEFLRLPGERRIPTVLNICKISKTEGKPILLPLHEVSCLFHEFGHIVHYILVQTEYAQLTPFSVERDFVEVPSQMMEFRTTDRESLSKLAKHYQTGESLSEETLDTLDKLSTFMMGNWLLRQIELSLVDNYLFTHDLPANLEEMDEIILNIVNQSSLSPKSKDYKQYCSFWHIFNNDYYACKYYSYLWADLHLNDIFQKIKKIGMFNREILKEYCDKILSPGARRPAEELFRDFMGREVDPTALLKKYGLQ